MKCRHLLGSVGGFCIQCGELVRLPQIKYSHPMRRLLWDESKIPVLVAGVAIVDSSDLEMLIVKRGEFAEREMMQMREVVL